LLGPGSGRQEYDVVKKNRGAQTAEAASRKESQNKVDAGKGDFGKQKSLALPAKDLKAQVKRAQTFLKEVRVEFDKVNWPSRKETLAMTMAVLVLTFFFTAYLGLIDITLSKLVNFLIY
jgi:preprotein translocase subunit SecE